MTEASTTSSLTGSIIPNSKTLPSQQQQTQQNQSPIHPQSQTPLQSQQQQQQQPVPQPPPPTQGDDNEGGSNSEIRCLCGYDDDDGYTIQYDKCDRWQHLVCMRISQKDVPDMWQCHVCNPDKFQEADRKRAHEKQRKRRDQEIRNQKRKTAGTTGKKKETGGHQRNDSESSHLPDSKTGSDRKPSSPKDNSSGKPRGRQRPPNATTAAAAANGGPNGASNFGSNLPSRADSNAGSNRNSPAVHSPGHDDENDSDAEVSPTVYNREYNLITSNSVLSAELQTNLLPLVKTVVPPESSFTAADFTSRFQTRHFKVRRASAPERSPNTASPPLYVTVEDICDANQFVLEYRGEIISQQDYKADTINQYKMIRHPKPFVLFHPNPRLPLCIDARRCGSEARFIRRSCKPNLELKTVLVDGSNVKFCLFTRSKLEAGAELTLPWEWDPTTSLAQYASNDVRPEAGSTEALKLTSLAETILSQFGGCACTDKKDCVFERLGDNAKSANKNSTRRKRPAEAPGASSSITVKEPTPDRLANGNHHHHIHNHNHPEENYKRRSSSSSSRGNSASRDRTPSYPMFDAPLPTAAELQFESAREARKMKDAVSLMEKLASQEGQQGRKRVKRPHSNPVASTGTDTSGGDKMVVDSETGEDRPSPEKRIKSASPIITQRPKPKVVYVDSCTQTEPLVFGPGSRSSLPPRRSASKKHRILAMFRREQLKCGLIKEEPTKLEGTPEDVPMFDASSNTVDQATTPTVPSAITQTPTQPDQMVVDDDNDNNNNNNASTNTNENSNSNNSNDADSNTIRVVDPSLKSPPLTSDANTVTTPPPVNGFRSADLHVPMPGGSSFPNAPTTPALVSAGVPVKPAGTIVQSPLTQSPPPLSSGLVPQPADTAANNSSINSASAPTPAKKKLSLSDYSRRRKADNPDKEKLVTPSSAQGPLSPGNLNQVASIPDVMAASAGSNDVTMMDVDVKTEGV